MVGVRGDLRNGLEPVPRETYECLFLVGVDERRSCLTVSLLLLVCMDSVCAIVSSSASDTLKSSTIVEPVYVAERCGGLCWTEAKPRPLGSALYKWARSGHVHEDHTMTGK
jgi:hypothetical protein